MHHNTESYTLGSVATLSRYGRQLHPPLKCSTVTFWASKVWPTVRPWTVFGAFHSFTVMLPIASVMTVSSIHRHFLPCCSCDTSSQNYHAHNVIIAFAHKHGNMYNRVVLNYIVKIKLRAMLSLTLPNNTFLWIIILCQIWVRKINVYR